MRRLVICTVVASLAVLLEGLVGPGLAMAQESAPAPRFVREAQRTLRELGYQPGPVDGAHAGTQILAFVLAEGNVITNSWVAAFDVRGAGKLRAAGNRSVKNDAKPRHELTRVPTALLRAFASRLDRCATSDGSGADVRTTDRWVATCA